MLRNCFVMPGLAAFLAASVLGSPSHGATCPADSLGLGGYGTLVTTRASLDSTRTLYGNFHARYDLAGGTLAVEQCCNLNPGTFADVTDLYDVVGVPPGTPVSCRVEFAVSGMIQTPGGVIVTTLEAGGTVQQSTHVINQNLGWYPTSDQLVKDLTIVAGSPQPVRFALAGMRTVGSDINASGSSAQGGFHFGGLPAGATVVSCQGYPSGVVPTRASTWGRLKSIYR